jgi:rRNA-processing protein FCF1
MLATLAGHAVALIPWTVIYELDSLKASEKKEAATAARHVTHQLERLLQQGNSCWHIQKPADERIAAAEADSLRPSGARVTADDKIVATALVLRKLRVDVLLLSNDTNLRVRANVCGVLAVPDYGFPMTAAELKALVSSWPPLAEHSISEAAEPVKPVTAPGASDDGDQMLPESRDRPPRDAGALMDAALACVERGASPILESIVRDEFGSQWDIAVQEPPPWDGRKCCRMISRHWTSTFKTRMSRDVLHVAQGLEEAIKSRRSEGPWAAARIAALVCDLLHALPADGTGAQMLLREREEAEALRASPAGV